MHFRLDFKHLEPHDIQKRRWKWFIRLKRFIEFSRRFINFTSNSFFIFWLIFNNVKNLFYFYYVEEKNLGCIKKALKVGLPVEMVN